MIGSITAEALRGRRTGRAFVRSITTSETTRTLLAKFRAVAEPLAVEAAERVWHEDANLIADVSGKESVRQLGGVESDHEEAGVTPLSVTEGGKTADMRHTFRSETVQEFLLRHVPQFRSEDRAFGGVTSVVK